ncbi:MAG: sodium:panthothenate symporter [Kiritimatiellae bacterium]|nr:sodium:panthothenate symporter [Kiritimatiellia bacterium]
MSFIDWLILVVPVAIVMGMGFYTRRYVRGVSDFLSAGRLCGRYVICMGDVANALSVIGLVTFIEIQYKTGFSVGFWSSVLVPLSTVLSLTGFCSYRFRATRAMSLGQFLEMRYSRRFRIFAASLRSLAEIIANMIMPALAARFFIQMLDLPAAFSFCGLEIATFPALMVAFLSLAVTLICCGGTLALVVTDTVQGMILYPIIACFVIFLFAKFSFSDEILPVMMDRVPGESFLNPYDISKLRDFNLFTVVIVAAYNMIVNRANWIGAGYTTAAKTPHEQKMADILGGWRWAIISVFYVLVACSLITFLNHRDFARQAHAVRQNLAMRVADDVLRDDPAARDAVRSAVAELPVIVHEIGTDPPLSQADNPDTQFLDVVHQALLNLAARGEAAGMRVAGDEGGVAESPSPVTGHPPHGAEGAIGRANDRFQQCRTLFNQLNLSATLRALLPPGLFGLFVLLLFLAMLSTDDTRIYSAALTIAQDVVLPLRKKPFTPQGHVWMIRIVAILIGVFFLFGSYFMKQLDYLQMFVTLACSMWVSGAGPVMLFGLYSRIGTTAAAWTSLVTSTISSIGFVLVQRNWADVVYPALVRAGLMERCDRILRALSVPFDPWIVWKMDPVKCPVNTIEFTFFLSVFCLALYAIVSKLTCKEPFNLDRMLHRGEYALESEGRRVEGPAHVTAPIRLWRGIRAVPKALIGITPEYSRGDKWIAWGVFAHNFIYGFCLCFLATVVWNGFHRWPIRWWGGYFLVRHFAVPCLIAVFSTVWFGVGGFLGLRQLFRDLANRGEIDPDDDGRVV